MSSAEQLAQSVRLFIADIDGVCTDGNLYLTDNDELCKAFNTLDGLGLKLLQRMDIHVGVITARYSPPVAYRMETLGVEHIYMGYEDKRSAYQDLLNKLNLNPQQVAYIGDDLPDLPLIIRSGLGMCVQDAYCVLHDYADWCSSLPGGHGAVRQACDFLLQAQNKWDAAIASYVDMA